jgi:hypothetical protein
LEAVPNSIGEVDLASASCLERFSNGGFDIHQWISLSLVVCDDSTGEECENFLHIDDGFEIKRICLVLGRSRKY